MTPDEANKEVVAYINRTPKLLSLLYDMDLLPEQALGDMRKRHMMTLAAVGYAHGAGEAISKQPDP